MKPSWKKSPEWAKYLVMDSRGIWTWHEQKPVPLNGEWWSNQKSDLAFCKSDWTKTLEKRPRKKK